MKNKTQINLGISVDTTMYATGEEVDIPRGVASSGNSKTDESRLRGDA